MRMGQALFISGTGTDVGKSALSLAVLLWARGKGLDAAYFKPVQCGEFPFGNPPTPHGDADWMAALLGGSAQTHVTYRFPSPVSPHLAAEREGQTIHADRIREDLENLLEDHDLVVMEGAGGAAVPLDRQGNSLAVLAAEMEIPCLLACAPGLGTLHHTLATLAYLGALEAPVAGFAFCHRDPTVPDIFEDNRRTLEALTGLPCFGAVPYSPSLAGAPRLGRPASSPSTEAGQAEAAPGAPLSATEADALASPLSPSLDSWWNSTRA